MKSLYIGIDDTDNLKTRGTGFRARQLLEKLTQKKLVEALGITRHQLLVDDRVPYTSHNSSACIAVHTDHNKQDIIDFCRGFLIDIAADGSDVGLCVSGSEDAMAVTSFGQQAKKELMYQKTARQLAHQTRIFLEGLTGDHQGIIGALSAVGLYADGNDGRYIWSRGLREHANQSMTLSELNTISNFVQVMLDNHTKLTDPDAKIQLGAWPRAVRYNHQAILLVEHCHANQYKVINKDRIKALCL